MQNMKTREFKKLLRDNGFHEARQSGSHIIYERTQTISAPLSDTEINGCMAARLLKEAGIKVK